jgi:hypothetical protein
MAAPDQMPKITDPLSRGSHPYMVRDPWLAGSSIASRAQPPVKPLEKSIQWTDVPSGGQVERMNRTIKDATVKRFHYDSHDQLRTHLTDFLAAYNFARRLKTLGGLTP